MLPSKQPKTAYTEAQAAAELGIPVERLRTLIKDHIVKNDEEMAGASVASFNASDLLVLRILASAEVSSTR